MTAFLYQLLELFATFVEGFIIISVTGEMSGKKYENKLHWLFVTIGSVIYTVVVTLMNQWQAFSFLTIAISVVVCLLISRFITTGKFVNRLTAVILCFFFINALDYLISYSQIMIMGKSLNISEGIPLILCQGPARAMFLLILKGSQIIVFLAFSKVFPKFQLIEKNGVILILIITSLSYIVMSVLTQLILTESFLTLQISVILSVFFIILTIIGTIAAVSLSAKYQNKKRDAELMAISNQLMEKNFSELQGSQNIIRQQVHDFKNHIRTINVMLPEESEVKAYTESLLSQTYQQAKYCKSGNHTIDSIINCKAIDAEKQHIAFTYSVRLTTPLTIAPADICAILANQIDNALEACLKIDETDNRFVNVEIYQKEAFTFFKVVNACAENPFNENRELKSTKDNSDGMHGFGIRNIRETAARNNGTMKNEFKDNSFVSIVMVLNSH